jgi:hypothetical protein
MSSSLGPLTAFIRVFVGSMAIATTSPSSGAQDWEKADLATARLPPSAFPELPASIQKELERRGCTIPQPFIGTHQNVISGRFTSAKQTDWAVLCSVKRRSSILVFRPGSAAVAELAEQPDSGALQMIGGGAIGYSRALGVADAEFIRVHHERYGGRKPPPLDHDGIDDVFVEKGSTVWYWYRARWLQLTGSN